MNSSEKLILDLIETKHPSNVKELVQLVQEQTGITLDEIERELKNLREKGLISLEEPEHHKKRLINFLSLKTSPWFWIVVVTSLLSFASIIFLPETGTPLSYVRYVFAFVLVAFIPGYCLTETLFPKEDDLDTIERLTFSIGLSFATTALVSLLLSFTPFGLTLFTVLPSLGFLVIVLVIVGSIRKYKIT